MNKFCKEQWNCNRELLEDALKEHPNLDGCDYKDLVQLVVRNILNASIDKSIGTWNADEITEIDNGDYQGTLLFLIPKDCYQPDEAEYLMTFINYGSCTVCDTLQNIHCDMSGEEQIRGYMALCKDMVTNMIKPYNYGWRYDERFETVVDDG